VCAGVAAAAVAAEVTAGAAWRGVAHPLCLSEGQGVPLAQSQHLTSHEPLRHTWNELQILQIAFPSQHFAAFALI